MRKLAPLASWESSHLGQCLLVCTLSLSRSHAFQLLGRVEQLSGPAPSSWSVSPLLPLTSSLFSQDSNLSLHTDNPDLTPCFQNSLLAWLPCTYLWAALPCYLFYLRRRRQGYIVLSHLSRLKTVRGSGSPVGGTGT